MTYRVQWLLLAGAALIGATPFALVDGLRSGRAFVLGVLIAGIAFTLSIAAVRFADRISPAMSMLVALITYTTCAAAFAAVFARLDRDAVPPGPFAAGLVCAVVLWVIEQWRIARPPPPA